MEMLNGIKPGERGEENDISFVKTPGEHTQKKHKEKTYPGIGYSGGWLHSNWFGGWQFPAIRRKALSKYRFFLIKDKLPDRAGPGPVRVVSEWVKNI